MTEILKSVIAAIGIDIGKNWFHVVGLDVLWQYRAGCGKLAAIATEGGAQHARVTRGSAGGAALFRHGLRHHPAVESRMGQFLGTAELYYKQRDMVGLSDDEGLERHLHAERGTAD